MEALQSQVKNRLIALAFSLGRFSPPPRSGNPKGLNPEAQAQPHGFHSLQRSMTEIFRLGLANNSALFPNSYMKFKNLTGSKQAHILFSFLSIIKSPFHWEGLKVTQESNF